MKQLCFKTNLLTILFVFVSVFAFSQNYETSKSLEKSADVSGNVIVKMSNYSGDLKITTSNITTVKIITKVKISGNKKEDVDKVIQEIDNFDFKHSGNTLTIDTRFYKNMQSINNRRTITLQDGSKVKIKEFNIYHEMQIPATARLELNNKYSDVEIQDLKGASDFELYSSKLQTGNLSGNIQIEAKYSKIYLKEITGSLSLDIYDSDINFISASDVSIRSKYSKINAKKVASLNLDSYDDKFYIDEIDDLKFVAKYSDLVSKAELSNLTLELYDSNIEINSAKSGNFSGKYSDLKLGNVQQFNIAESYDNNIFFGKTMDVRIDKSQYCDYKFSEVSKFTMEGYDDNVNISNLNSEFSGISMNGKYGKLNVQTGDVPFQLNFKIMYPKIDIPESVKTVKHIEKNGATELIANETGGLISVDGYDMKVVIK